VGGINFNSQTTTGSTGNGSTVATIGVGMVENAGAGARGSQFYVQTVNTGTTTFGTRLVLQDRASQYYSDTHSFRDKTGSFTALQMSTATAVFTTIPVVPTYTTATIKLVTGQSGAMVAISNATPAGRFAYWDTTNSLWKYIADDSTVTS
jgi:hypothetical protein